MNHPIIYPGDEMSADADLGDISVNDDVLALHASVAMGRVEGVVSLSGRRGMPEIVAGKIKDVIDKGITVTTDKTTGHCNVNVEVNVEYGRNVLDVARLLQRSIKEEIEGMCGQRVDRVNVTVKGMVPKEPASKPVA